MTCITETVSGHISFTGYIYEVDHASIIMSLKLGLPFNRITWSGLNHICTISEANSFMLTLTFMTLKWIGLWWKGNNKTMIY
jgi:hypothetical protein